MNSLLLPRPECDEVTGLRRPKKTPSISSAVMMATSATAVGSERMTEEREGRLGKARKGGEAVMGVAAAEDDSIAANTKSCGLTQRNVFSDPARTANVLKPRC